MTRLGQRNGEQRLQFGAVLTGELLVHGLDVDLVIVQRVQRRGSGGRHPGGGGSRAGLRDLLRNHVRHQVGHGPHALSDLRLTRQTGTQAGVDVVVLVCQDPRLRLHDGLAAHRARFHGGVDLIAGAIQEAGVDEDHPIRGGLDGGLEVDGGATLLVHDADLEGGVRESEHLFDAAKQLGGEGHFLGPVHLGLHDVDGPGAAVLQRTVLLAGTKTVDRDQAGEQRILDALRHLVTCGIHDGVIGHQMADVADEQQAAARQGQLALAVRGVEHAVLVEHPGECLAALGNILGQITLVESQPVSVPEHLVFGVHGSHGVLEIHDRGDRRLQHDILDSSLVGGSDGGVGVDEDLDVQAMVDEQHRPLRLAELAGVADELIGVLQTHRELVTQLDEQLTVVDLQADGVLPGAARQRGRAVEHVAGVGDDLVAADLVVPTCADGLFLGAIGFGDDIGAVQRVVEGAPARVGGVEREARVQDRNHQLRPGSRGDLVVHIGGGDGEIFGLGDQVPDLGEELPVRRLVQRLDGTLPVPAIDLSLQVVPTVE